MDYIKNREFLIKKIILAGGAWQSTDCQDEVLEKEFDSLLTQLHPNLETSIAILQQHISGEVAA
ncbi:hypothetical protein ACQKDB_15910 [Planococcus kocurii]|uniref:hypothetical protein n=1 Tax=Planococcus kocurii TaxID=1374 RepID=UPI003CFBD77C